MKSWERWGPDDEIGTLNHVTASDVVSAARLIRRGWVFSIALPFDGNGPQNGLWGNRFNPIHTMLASGTDAVAGLQDSLGLRYSDDVVTMPLQCGTQWDALGHIFFNDKMWNGYVARLVDSKGAHKNAIEKTKRNCWNDGCRTSRNCRFSSRRIEGITRLSMALWLGRGSSGHRISVTGRPTAHSVLIEKAAHARNLVSQ